MLERVTTVKDQCSIVCPDGEGPSTVGIDQIVIAIAISVAHCCGGFKSAQMLGLLQLSRIWKHGFVQCELANTGLLRKSVIILCITLIGGNQIGCSLDAVSRNGIRLIHHQNRPALHGDPAILIRHVVACARHILNPETSNASHPCCGDVYHGNGVVFLKGDIGCLSIRREGNIFRFCISGEIASGLDDATTGWRGFTLQ